MYRICSISCNRPTAFVKKSRCTAYRRHADTKDFRHLINMPIVMFVSQRRCLTSRSGLHCKYGFDS